MKQNWQQRLQFTYSRKVQNLIEILKKERALAFQKRVDEVNASCISP